MKPMLGLVAFVLAGCASAHGDAPRPSPRACDATGVWRVDVGEILEVTVDPALVRVELPERSIGADAGLAVAVDLAACRLHVVHRSTQRYEEGYGNTDSTLRVSFSMRGTRATVTGARRTLTLDPPDETSHRVRGTAERKARWTEPSSPP
jgi:hypothetical protein